MTVPATMQVVAISAPGGPDVLQLGERPVPQPGAGEVLIKVAAAGVNGPDLMQRKVSTRPARRLTSASKWPARSRLRARSPSPVPGNKVTALPTAAAAESCAADARHRPPPQLNP
jgi:hypothetical protein